MQPFFDFIFSALISLRKIAILNLAGNDSSQAISTIDKINQVCDEVYSYITRDLSSRKYFGVADIPLLKYLLMIYILFTSTFAL